MNKSSYLKLLLAPVLLFAFFVLLLLPSCIEGIQNNQDVSFIYHIIVSVIVIAAFLFLTFKKRPYISPSYIAFCFIYIIINILVVALSIDFNASIKPFFNSVGASLLNCLTAGLFLFIVYKFFDIKTVRGFIDMFIVFMLIAFLYSAIAEFNTIIKSFTASGEDAHFYQVKSIFDGRNQYGFLLFTAIFFSFYLKNKETQFKTNLVLNIIIFVFFVGVVLSRSKLPLLFSFVLIAYHFVLFMVKEFKNRRKVFVGWAIALAIVIIALTLLVTVPALYNTTTFTAKLHNYVSEAFIGQAIRSFKYRLKDYENLAPLFTSWRIIFGYGALINPIEVNGEIVLANIDNAFVSSLVQGGIVQILILVLIYWVVIKKILMLHHYNKKLSVLFFIFLGFTFVYGLFESYGLFGHTLFNVILLISVFMIPSVEVLESRASLKDNTKVLHVVGSFDQGGTEAFILSYFNEIKKHVDVTFDVYCFNNVNPIMEEKLNSLGGKVYRGMAPSKKNMFKAKREFEKFLVAHPEYDIIHCSANFDSAIYLMVANEYNISKRIGHAHDILTGIRKDLIMKTKNVICRWNATQLVGCSLEAGKDIFGKSFLKSGVIINNSIDIERFTSVNKEDITELEKQYNLEGKIVFGNISRFEPKKNQTFIVDYFEKIHALNKDTILILGGVDGGDLDKIVNLVKEKGLDDSVKFIGPRDDVPVWLNVIDYYLMPSLYEGFGISALEAQVARCRVLISSNFPASIDLKLGNLKMLDLDIDKWINETAFEKARLEKNESIRLDDFDIRTNYKNLIRLYDISCEL